MKLFTRISATLSATAENAVNRFENHDAIAQSALVEARRAIARARIRHQRMTRQLGDLRKTLADAENQEQLWTTRAQKFADSDQTRALQCLEHRMQCRANIEQHMQTLNKHEAHEQQMAKRLKDMQDRLHSMETQHNEMRSRESLAKATKVLDRIDHDGHDGVNAVFERWELAISDDEIESNAFQGTQSALPTLEKELEMEEHNAALKDELTELIAARKD